MSIIVRGAFGLAIAALVALGLAGGGRRTLLTEVEGRQGIAQLFGTEPLPYRELRIARIPGGGEVRALRSRNTPAAARVASVSPPMPFLDAAH